METSALTGESVEDSFLNTAREIMKRVYSGWYAHVQFAPLLIGTLSHPLILDIALNSMLLTLIDYKRIDPSQRPSPAIVNIADSVQIIYY